MRLATLPLLNDPAYSATDTQALRRYFLERVNPITALCTKPDSLLGAVLGHYPEHRKVVERLSDPALMTLMRFDIAMAVDALCGTDPGKQRVALQALIATIDAGRINGYAACMALTMAEALGCFRSGHAGAMQVVERVRVQAYETPKPDMLPTETILMTISAHESSSYAVRVRGILRAAAVDLLAECEAAR